VCGRKQCGQLLAFVGKLVPSCLTGFLAFGDGSNRRPIGTRISLQSAFVNLLSRQQSLDLHKPILVESIPLHEEKHDVSLTHMKAQPIACSISGATKADSVALHFHLEASHCA
jgi:hypothetical protein